MIETIQFETSSATGQYWSVRLQTYFFHFYKS